MRKAAFAGSFDPPTYGHLDIIERAARLFNGLTVVVADNTDKKCLFSLDERKALLEELARETPGVHAALCPPRTLLAPFLAEMGINVLVRGLRRGADFEYEADMARINSVYNSELETVFIAARPALEFISSSAVRTLLLYNAGVSRFVPEAVNAAISRKKYGEN
jgi:pantetheine-phosphate adenylyltransferase